MALAQVQKKTGTESASPATVTLDSTPIAGNLLIAVVNSNNNSITTPAGWQQDADITPWLTTGHISIFSKLAGTGESTSLSFTSTGATSTVVHAFEYSGAAISGWADQTGSTADTGSGVTSRSSGTTGTTTLANELCVAAVAVGNTVTGLSWNNSFSSQTTSTTLKVATRIVSSIATYQTTASWTTSRQAAGIIATYKQAPPSSGFFGII